MMNKEKMNNLKIENARLVFRNFSGREGPYNAAGQRQFLVVLDDDIARKLKDDGWAVRYLKPKDDDDTPTPVLPVKVAFGKMPPKIVQITSGHQTLLDEDSVGKLDWADIASADLIIRPYMWAVSDKSGIKAYLKAMYVTLEEDEFERKYANIPFSSTEAPADFDPDDDDLPF